MKLNKFNELSYGYFRYVVAAKVCYEIIVHGQMDFGVDMEDADDCELFITGLWRDNDGKSIFSREKLAKGSMKECLDACKKDMENFK